MKQRAESKQVQAARASVDHVEAELASILWGILRDSIRADDLAEAARDDESTLSRMTASRDMVRFRVSAIVAVGALNPEAGRKMLDVVASELGFEIRPALHAVVPSSETEAASQFGEQAGHAAMLLCRFLGDGKLDEVEREELRRELPKLEWALKRVDAALEARAAS